MKIIKLICTTLMIFVLAYNTNAQEEGYSSAEDLLEEFFSLFARNIDAGIDFLFSTNELIDPKQPGIASIKERFDMSRRLLGEYHGHEIIREYRAGYSYRKYSYSLKYERQPLKIDIVLYKPNDRWKVQNVNFHDDVGADFKEHERTKK